MEGWEGVNCETITAMGCYLQTLKKTQLSAAMSAAPHPVDVVHAMSCMQSQPIRGPRARRVGF